MPILPNTTLSYIVNFVNRTNSDVVVEPPLSRATFNLDSSGVAGFFGGESAVKASATLNLLQQRRFLGLYNAPGSYEVAKQYSGLLKSKIFDALFPSVDTSPSHILMVDGRVGPESTPLFSPPNTALSGIGHLGSLIARKVSKLGDTKESEARIMAMQEASRGVGTGNSAAKDPAGEKNTPEVKQRGPRRVTFICLNRNPDKSQDLERQQSDGATIFTVFTILVSVGGCVACALVADWFCLASIAIGMFANAVGCRVIGLGKLYIEHPLPARGDFPGDVVLRSDTEIIVLAGKEGNVRPFTHGRFDLRFPGMPGFDPKKAQENNGEQKEKGDILMEYLINISITLLLVQFLAQLLLIPQGTLFGQLMFISTLICSWTYHSYLSSISLDGQTNALFTKLSIKDREDILQYPFSTNTQAVVFACLAFRSIHLLRLNPDIAEEMAEESPYTDKAYKEKAAKKAENVDTAFKTLLFALLPEEASALQAFRQSLVRKMSRSAIVTYAKDTNPSFKFDNQRFDALVQSATGESTLGSTDKRELEGYQMEAQRALENWRSKFWDQEEMRKLAALYQ